MSVLKILFGLGFCLWILILWSRRKYYKLILQLPGPIGLPLIGVLYKMKSLEGIYFYAKELQEKYRFPLLAWAGPFPTFILMDPHNAQDILTSPHCVNKACLYAPIGNVIGNGLLTLGNPKWSAHRKLLNPSFSLENIRSFVPIFNEKTKTFLMDFEISYGGESINMLSVMQRLSMNMALQTTMGLKSVNQTNSFDEKTEERLFEYYHYLADRVMILMLMPWLRLKMIQKFLPSFKRYITSKTELRNFFKNLIHEKLELSSDTDNTTTVKFKEDKEVENDDLPKRQKNIFMDIAIDLLRNGKFTAQEVEDHANNIVAGAFETTATTITHTLIMLAMNPQYQEIAFEEIFALYADRDNVYVTDEDLHRLVYLEMVINETMRLVPTVPVIARTATSDVRLTSGIVLPAGIQILIDIFDLHRNKSIWGPNALVFNPENFLPENMREKHPYAFIPFTKGIRSCIGYRYGMNATKIVLGILLRKYRFTTTSKFEDLRYEPTISLRFINAPLLKLHKREK